MSSKIAPWHQKLWVFSGGAALSMPDEDPHLGTNQALSYWQLSGGRKIYGEEGAPGPAPEVMGGSRAWNVCVYGQLPSDTWTGTSPEWYRIND